MKLPQVKVGDNFFTWSVTAYVGAVTRTSTNGKFNVCVKGYPGTVYLVSPSGNMYNYGSSITFSWTLSSWGHICNFPRSSLVYELYIQEQGKAANKRATCLPNATFMLDVTFCLQIGAMPA